VHRHAEHSKAPVSTGAFLRSPLLPPALLPWQFLILAWLSGIWSTRFALPGLCGLGLALGLHAGSTQPLRRMLLRSTLMLAAALLGMLMTTGRPTSVLSSLMQPDLRPALPAAPHDTAAATLPSFVTDRTPVALTGTVASVSPAPENRLQIILEDVRIRLPDDSRQEERLTGGLVWTWDHPVCTRDAGYPVGVGQTITMTRRIKPVRGFLNPGTWDSGQYWHDRGVRWRTWTGSHVPELRISGSPSRMWTLRERIRTRTMKILLADKALTPLPGNASAVMPALLFGDRFDLTYQRLDQLSLASLSHSLALSGMHLGVMASLGWGVACLLGWLAPSIFLRLPRPKCAVLLAGPLVFLYVWLGGASPSLLRAALMFACWGFMLWRNRPRVLLDGLFVAVLLITLHSPVALFDLRLQLSALAILSLALFLPMLRVLLDRIAPPLPSQGTPPRIARPAMSAMSARLRRVRTAVVALASTNLCIALGMLPVVAWHFNTGSPWFLLNLIWLPVLGLWILPAGMAGLLFSQIPGIPLCASLASLSFTAATTPVTWLFAALDGLQQTGWLVPHILLRPSWSAMAGYWTLLLAVPMLLGRHRRAITVLAAGTVLCAAALVHSTWEARHNAISLTVPDVGQGQSLLLTLPGPSEEIRRILTDGGGFGLTTFDTGRAIVTPVLTLHHWPGLDMIVNTHPDNDHLRGLLFPLRTMTVGGYACNGRTASATNAAALRQALQTAHLVPQVVAAGDALLPDALAPGIELAVLHPDRARTRGSTNNAALVLRLTRNGRGLALLMGDVEKEGIRTLLASGKDLSADVLVLPHHGSRSSLVPALYDAVRPRLAVAATGYLNQWGFPAAEVREALQQRGIPLLHTAANGQIRITWPAAPPSDGEAEPLPQVCAVQP